MWENLDSWIVGNRVMWFSKDRGLGDVSWDLFIKWLVKKKKV